MSEKRPFIRLAHTRRSKAVCGFLLSFAVLLGILFLVPTDYYVARPGSAVALGPLIDVEGGTKTHTGSFMMTTVRMGVANLAWYLYARLSDQAELMPKEQVVSKGEDNEDFVRRELTAMDNSQKIAEAVAFRMAGYDVAVKKEGVWVLGTIEGLPAKGVLQVGDVITAVDGVPTVEAKELQQLLAKRKAGETVKVTYVRDGKKATATFKLGVLPGTSTAGLGVRTDTKQNIEVPSKVTISSKGIGGPSAGLMMALEIYDQLRTDVDLTKGYQIAGTGTIALDGTVGRIGGIQHKVVAADNAGAEIFFAPDDPPNEHSNYREALKAAERIGTSMKIVPVKTIQEALDYLEKLEERKA